MIVCVALKMDIYRMNFVHSDPREELKREKIMIAQYPRDVQIGLLEFYTTKLGTSLTYVEKRELVALLQKKH